MKVKVKMVIEAELESNTIKSKTDIIQEFSSETNYNLSDTDNVKVINTELVECIVMRKEETT